MQIALSLLLMPILEADFRPPSFGLWRQRLSHQVNDDIQRAAQQGYVEIIDADLSRYFDTIFHRELLKTWPRW